MVTGTDQTATPQMSILFVCTGNICRSPIGERVLAGLAGRAGVSVTSTSAGVGALNGQPIHPHASAVLVENGYDAAGFESRYLRPPMLTDSDLVLCMSREHRTAAQQMAPARWKRVFTLTEFAGLCDLGSLPEIIAGRGRLDPNSDLLDIVDPMGRPREDFDRVFAEVEPKVEAVVAWLAAPGAKRAGQSTAAPGAKRAGQSAEAPAGLASAPRAGEGR